MKIRIIPSALICVLTVSSCSKIRELRPDSPKWGNDKKVKRVAYEENPPFDANGNPIKPMKKAPAGIAKKTPRNQPAPATIPVVQPNVIEPIRSTAPQVTSPLRSLPPVQPSVQPSVVTPGRKVQGLMEPQVTGLPDNKELQESNIVVPPTPAPIIRPLDTQPVIPNLPLLDDPNDGLIPAPDN